MKHSIERGDTQLDEKKVIREELTVLPPIICLCDTHHETGRCPVCMTLNLPERYALTQFFDDGTTRSAEIHGPLTSKAWYKLVKNVDGTPTEQ